MGTEARCSKIMLKLPILFLAFLSSVSAHGGVLWPPIWQAGVATPIEQLTTYAAFSDPKVHDPKSGRAVTSVKSWLTDQAYTGGVGDEFKGIGPVTNNQTKLLKPADRCGPMCVVNTNPWAAPGRAPSLGGGCGVFGGNPRGCPKDKDTRPPGSACGQAKPAGRGNRGTSSFGTDARLVGFPEMVTTEWPVGSVQEVAWASRGGHRGGYTYRLCKVPRKGRRGITEKCFAKNVLKFATNFTMMRPLEEVGAWEKFEQTDLTKGTFPKGSAWRPVGKVTTEGTIMRKDYVVVPDKLKPGEYVLGWRWDAATGNQVWVSCSSIRLVTAPSGRSAEEEVFKDEAEDKEEVYTDEEYQELEQAFQNY